MEGFKINDPTFPTRAIHVGSEPEKWNSMAVVPPISLATTYKQDAPAQFKVCLGLGYSKHGYCKLLVPN